jgi:hypothetical protein
MSQSYQPGELVSLQPQQKPNDRKPKGKLLFAGFGVGLILLCCIAAAIIAVIQRNHIPMLANLLASSTPTLTPTSTIPPTPTVTLTPTPEPGAKITGQVAFADTGASLATTVTLVNTTTQDEVSVDTDSRGYYEFQGVVPGSYQLEVVIPDAAINSCSNPRLTDNSEWQVVYRITADGAMTPMAQTIDFDVALGDNFLKSPALACN